MPAAGNFAGAQMESMAVSAAFHKRFKKWIGKQRLCLEIRERSPYSDRFCFAAFS